ncbi:LacI family DNA-binding transcriptional regulator [Rhizobium sp. TH2]|uniref:LacI family DNA-binding transcriptional regulator n=1 Tax=Rhizobium sp. TH2 TaxID=2775403 RepID=UPI002157B180|nr:LacI family DNA-binding transcriptional regulator [Rhizobium sp. TH2]UVC07767.1 LacI family DNA-binding transcriptional regulator [Rhizobium sp. TH2]
MTKPPSLQDVARAAKLSPATVSRYLNGSLNLPQETSDRIDAAIAALNYRPNPHARSLSRGRSDTIGLVVPDVANPFFAKLAAAVEHHAGQAGLGLMLCTSVNRQSRELEYIERLRRNHVDGLLFTTNHQDENQALAHAINASRNIVIMNEDIEGTDVPKIFSDNVQGAHLAAEKFLEAGHRRVVFVGGHSNIMSSRERAQGFKQTIEAAGATLTGELFGHYTTAYGKQAMAEVLERFPDATAIFVGSDEITFGMMEEAKNRGLRLGEDISIITFDDVGPLALFDPPVTAIRQSVDEIGRIGFELLCKRMEGDMSAPRIRLPVTLMERGSVKRLR